jgi:hypothetical protein
MPNFINSLDGNKNRFNDLIYELIRIIISTACLFELSYRLSSGKYCVLSAHFCTLQVHNFRIFWCLILTYFGTILIAPIIAFLALNVSFIFWRKMCSKKVQTEAQIFARIHR